jgi:hypothetical protein
MKGVGCRFGSTPTGCGRAMDCGARSGGKLGSSGSVGGGRRPRVGRAGPNGRILGPARKNSEKNKRAAREFWVGLISGYAEKKKKIFGFFIQGMVFKFKF